MDQDDTVLRQPASFRFMYGVLLAATMRFLLEHACTSTPCEQEHDRLLLCQGHREDSPSGHSSAEGAWLSMKLT